MPVEGVRGRWVGGWGGGSRWPLGSTQQVDTQQVERHQDQHQPDEDLLHPHTRVQLLLQPRVAGHHSHELVEEETGSATSVDPQAARKGVEITFTHTE